MIKLKAISTSYCSKPMQVPKVTLNHQLLMQKSLVIIQYTETSCISLSSSSGSSSKVSMESCSPTISPCCCSNLRSTTLRCQPIGSEPKLPLTKRPIQFLIYLSSRSRSRSFSSPLTSISKLTIKIVGKDWLVPSAS